jgi:hypothetical protein
MGGIYEVCHSDGLCAMIYIPSFVKIGSDTQKVISGDMQSISLLWESRRK